MIGCARRHEFDTGALDSTTPVRGNPITLLSTMAAPAGAAIVASGPGWDERLRSVKRASQARVLRFSDGDITVDMIDGDMVVE